MAYERVYLPLCKVADKPYRIQGGDCYHRSTKWQKKPPTLNAPDTLRLHESQSTADVDYQQGHGEHGV